MLSFIIGTFLLVAPARAVELRISYELTGMATVPDFAWRDFVRGLELLRSPILRPLDDQFSEALAWVRLQVSGEDLLDTHWRYTAERKGRAPNNNIASYALTGPRGLLAFALLLDRVANRREVKYDDGVIQFAINHRPDLGEMHVFAALLHLAYVVGPLAHAERSATARFDFELAPEERMARAVRFGSVLDELLRLDLGTLFSDEQRQWLRELRDEVHQALARCDVELASASE